MIRVHPHSKSASPPEEGVADLVLASTRRLTRESDWKVFKEPPDCGESLLPAFSGGCRSRRRETMLHLRTTVTAKFTHRSDLERASMTRERGALQR